MIIPLTEREVWEWILTRAFNRWHVLAIVINPLTSAYYYVYQSELDRRWRDVEQIVAAMKEYGIL